MQTHGQAGNGPDLNPGYRFLESLLTYFKERFNIEEKELELFLSKLERKDFPKKSDLLSAGSIEKHLSFVESGVVRLFVPKIENDLTFGFVFKNDFVCAYDSFLTQLPSDYSVQAITNTSVWRIRFDDLQDVYANSSIGNFIGRKASEALFLIKIKRELALLNQTPEERYLQLFTERPNVIKQIPLKYVASYIGITPQALSRIRKRIT